MMHICGCPEMGTYTGQVVLQAPEWLIHKWPNGIGIDVCIALEIQALWRAGIQTSGHCCGHGKADPYIGVFPEFIDRMKALGYRVRPNPSRPGAEDGFVPKTTLSAPSLPEIVAWGARGGDGWVFVTTFASQAESWKRDGHVVDELVRVCDIPKPVCAEAGNLTILEAK